MHTLALRAVVVLTAFLGATLLGAVPAQAHAGLTSVDPEPGTELAAPPEQVVFTFTEKLKEPSFAAVTLGGEPVEGWEGALDEERFIVTPPATDQFTSGTYMVSFRVVSADGHPIDGSTTFTITGGDADTDATADGDQGATPVEEQTNADDSGASSLLRSPWLWGVVIVAAVILLAATARRGARGDDSQS